MPAAPPAASALPPLGEPTLVSSAAPTALSSRAPSYDEKKLSAEAERDLVVDARRAQLADGTSVVLDHDNIGSGTGQTKRRLKSRHVSMIGLSGGIGIGLYLGTGAALAKAGPVGLILAYFITGAVLCCVMYCLGEMCTLIPGAGSFVHFSARFIDPAVGVSQGWNYWWCYAIGIASELSAAAVVITYWISNDTVNIGVWIAIMFVGMVALNLCFGVNAFGESEVVTGMVKVIAFLVLIILGIVIDLGGGPTHDRIGFRYFIEPGPFAPFGNLTGSLSNFLAFFSAFINAAFTYIGVETVVLAAGEATNPTRQIPKAVDRVLYRILFFYLGGVIVIALCVPYNDPNLLTGGGTASASPFVIMMDRARIRVLPHMMNAVILISAWSAGSSYIYVASRTLYSLALQKQAPSFLLKLTPKGIPVYCVLISSAVGLLSFLSLGAGGANQAFLWLSGLSSIAGLAAWATICFSYIRFHAALRVQGISRDTLPYKRRGTLYGAWFGAIVSIIIILFSGWQVFLAGNWDTSSFVVSYIGIPLYVLPIIIWKLWKKSKWVKLTEMDLFSGRMEAEDEEYEKVPNTWYEKLWAWMF